jgi:hypothetical protein
MDAITISRGRRVALARGFIMAKSQVAGKKSAKDWPSGVDFAGAYDALQKMLATYEKNFNVMPNKAGRYWLETKHPAYKGKPLLFAGVSLHKSYVSYYFMPIYVKPELAKNLSPELRKRKQGKCCFNFAAPDAALFKELKQLTRTGYDCYQNKSFLSAMDDMRKAGTKKKAAAGAH